MKLNQARGRPRVTVGKIPFEAARSQKYRKQPHAKVQAAGMDASKAS